MKVGPILGILSTPRLHSSPINSNQSESFAEIIKVAKGMNCMAFVFNPCEIDWDKKAVWGYYYNDRTKPAQWERQLFPLPNVIYNRIPNRTLENREDIKDNLSMLKKKYGARFFNPCFLDKWKTHAILNSNRHSRAFLPKTNRLNSPIVIAEMLERFRSVYLKPCANSLGNDIFRVSKKEGKFHFIHQTLNQTTREGLVPNCAAVASELPANINEYLVQQDIRLARFKGRAFDLRVLVQKNKKGIWSKTGVAARIAGEKSITTHVFYGGYRSAAESVISAAAKKYRFSYADVKNQLNKMQTLIPEVIENAYSEPFGEIEMDVGVDSKGKVWFLEANSKPFRFDEPLIRAKSLVRLIHYVRYLDSRCKRSEHQIG